MYIGAHVSISKGFAAAVSAAAAMGGNTFQFFSRNPRGGSAKALDLQDIGKAHDLMKEYGFGPVVAHTPYTYNLASAKPGIREFTLRTLKDDMARAEAMGTSYLVLHAGSHGGQGEEKGLELIVKGLREALAVMPESIWLLIEMMAGEGSELGYTFGQLKFLLEACDRHPRLGFCLDSCHMTGAGYDLSRLEEVKAEMDREVGLERLKAFHLNDSLYPLGSKRDRHAKLGEGYLGLDIIRQVVCDRDLQKLPVILETPNDDEGYAREIALVKSLCT